MKDSDSATPVSQISQIKQAIELLGPQAIFVPCRTDNLHIKSEKELNAAAIPLYIENSTHYSNLKFKENSAPEGYLFLTLDYDDHDGKGTIDIKAFKKEFSLPDTYTVKTPTGQGYQETYLVPESTNLVKPKYEFGGVEIFLGVRSSNSLRAVPGSSKENGMYTLARAMKPAEISDKLLSALKVQQSADITQNIMPNLELGAHYKGETDSIQSMKDALTYLNREADKFMIGEGPDLTGNRDKYLFSLACQLATYNLSIPRIASFITDKIFIDSIFTNKDGLEEDIVALKAKAAFIYIDSVARTTERATDLGTFEFDEFGKVTASREEYIKKVEYLSKYSTRAVMTNEKLRKTLYELIVFDRESNEYYVPNMYPKESYDREFKESLIEEQKDDAMVNYRELLNSKVSTALHWIKYSPKDFNEAYYIYAGNRRKGVTSTPEFLDAHMQARVFTTKTPTSGNILEYDNFYAVPAPAIPAILDPSKEEIKRVNVLLEQMITRITNPSNVKEEMGWFLDRMAKLYRSPHNRTNNCMILLGPQGSGKSAIIQLFMALFPTNLTNMLYSNEDIESKFTNWSSFTHIDDIDFNTIKPKEIAKLKGLITAESTPYEKKFHDRVFQSSALNLSIGTNGPINEKEFLSGRRYTILINEQAYHVEAIRKQVRYEYREFKANDWHLLSVLAGMLLSRDTENFKANYKTPAQYELILEANKGSSMTKFLVNLIANYGYIAPNHPVFIPGEVINRNDVLVMAEHYENPQDIKHYHNPKHGKQVRSLMDFEDRGFRNIANAEWNAIFKDVGRKVQSRVNPLITRTYSNMVPDIQEWIKLLTFYDTFDTSLSSIQTVVDRYELHEQWEWDNETNPERQDLGTINQYDGLDLFELEDEF